LLLCLERQSSKEGWIILSSVRGNEAALFRIIVAVLMTVEVPSHHEDHQGMMMIRAKQFWGVV